MRELGLQGMRHGRVKRTTITDDAAARPADLVQWDFGAARSDQLWVCDPDLHPDVGRVRLRRVPNGVTHPAHPALRRTPPGRTIPAATV